MAKDSSKKRKLAKKSDETPNMKKQKKSSNNNPDPEDPEPIENLLEPYTKEQLLSLAVDAALSSPPLTALIRSLADTDISHRKIFVYGLARDTTRDTLLDVFSQFGETEDCNLVIDHVTGKAKGYAFVVFKTRKAAAKALKQPQKLINNRLASCKLASVKDTAVSSNDLSSRKIYVSNVPHDTNPEKLRDLFAKFGEIEAGPMGFDPQTGKSKGYALFVYKTADEAKKCLEEPNKMFNGRQLYCKKAAEGKSSSGAASITTEIVHQPQLLPGGYNAAQSMGIMGQNPSVAMMNPFYGGLLANPYAGYVNPFLGVGAFGQQMGVAGYGAASVLGASSSSNVGGVTPGLLQSYSSKQLGQPSPAKLPGSSGYSSYL